MNYQIKSNLYKYLVLKSSKTASLICFLILESSVDFVIMSFSLSSNGIIMETVGVCCVHIALVMCRRGMRHSIISSAVADSSSFKREISEFPLLSSLDTSVAYKAG